LELRLLSADIETAFHDEEETRTVKDTENDRDGTEKTDVLSHLLKGSSY